MKRILLTISLFLLAFTLTACKGEPEPTDNPDPGPDMSWKIDYEMVDSSPAFLEDVSVCYQIFPISWADSNNDGYGDIKGITENLDYLSNTLGIDCIWINPVNLSPSYHKYDVVDYYSIDPQFGTLEDYEELLDASNQAGVKILMDLVINHTAYSNPWFIDSMSSKDSEYRDWYVWNDLTDRTKYPSKSGWSYSNGEFYYASFWSQMPELNFDNQEVRLKIEDIVEYWLEKGVDGFRIDAAKHIYDNNEYPAGTPTLRENINYFRSLNAFAKSINPNAFIVGEIASPQPAFIDNFYEGMDSAFNFDFAESIIYSLNAGYDSNTIGGLIEARDLYGDVRSDYIDSIFLSNHDQDRFMNKISHNIDKAKLAAQIMMTLPGISWVYYGEEIGMTGIGAHENIRQPFVWGDNNLYNTDGKIGGISSWDDLNGSLDGVYEQLLDNDSLLNVYIEMISLKTSNDVLKYGDLAEISNSNNRLMTYTRTYDGTTYLVVNNMSSTAKTVDTNIETYSIIYQSDSITYDQTNITFEPYSTTIFEVDMNDITFE